MSYTEQNKAWCLNQKWKAARWETLKYTFGEGALVRYVDEPALADMEGLVEFLLDAESCANLKVNEKRVHGTYVPAAAWWETVTVRGAERVRLYHECVPADAAGSGTAYVTENGCTYTVTMTPYFRQAAVAAPPAGTSGVSYRITGERADPRTGLWMFTLEKREQKTTTTGVVTVRDDAFATVTEQTFYGVRTGNTDHTGAAVSGLWTAGVSPAGTLVENVQVRKNENCTTDVTQRKTVAKAGVVTGGRSSEDTFATVTTVEDVSATALGAAPEPVGGVTVEHKDELDKDGLYRRTKATETEREVDGAVSMTAIDKAEQVTETENRGKAAALAAPTDPEGTLSNVTNTKSKAGRWTQRLRQTVANLWTDHTIRRVRDAFGLEEEKRSDGVATADLPATPEDAAGGVWNEQTIKQRKDGKWDVAATTHAEADVAVSESVSEVTPLEKVTETESIGADQAAEPESAAGYIRRAVRSLTRGRKWRNRVIQRQEKAYLLTFDARKTFDESVTGEAGQAGAVTLDSAGVGTYSTASASLTQTGLLRYAIQRIVENLWSKTYRAADDFFSTTEAERGVAGSLTFSAASGSSVQASAEVTNGGLLRYVKQTETAKAGQSWTLLNQTTSNFQGYPFEKVLVRLYANVEISQAQADVAAFVAGSVEFVIIRGSTTTHYYWEHDIGFGLHVNKFGKWDGTVTLRAKAVPGYATTTT